MKSAPTPGLALPALRALAVAATMACTASAALAAGASLSITSFTVAAEDYSGNYVWTLDAYQDYNLSALDGGGLYGAAADSYTANDWNLGLNRLAQTSYAQATGNTVRFTDGATALTTAGFNLGASALPGPYPAGTPASYANASAVQAGAFTLIDENGNAAAGRITFDIYYNFDVSGPGGGSYGQTVLSLLYSSDATDTVSFADGLLSNAGAASTSGHFTWAFTLAAGEVAYYTLSSSAIAAAVPEPSALALSVAGLFTVGALLRRRREAVKAG